jgi:hypothetical protein
MQTIMKYNKKNIINIILIFILIIIINIIDQIQMYKSLIMINKPFYNLIAISISNNNNIVNKKYKMIDNINAYYIDTNNTIQILFKQVYINQFIQHTHIYVHISIDKHTYLYINIASVVTPLWNIYIYISYMCKTH